MSFKRWYPIGGALGKDEPERDWDRVILQGNVIPCHHARITQGHVKLAVDKKKTLGGNGANPTYHGIDPQSLIIEVFFTTLEQIQKFKLLCDQIGPSINADPAKQVPVQIYAQQLQHLGAITNVKVTGITAIEGDSIKRCRIMCDHWLKPPVNKAGPSASKTVTYKYPSNKVLTDTINRKANPKPSAQGGFCGNHSVGVSGN